MARSHPVDRHPREGAPAPLLERLIDEAPDVPVEAEPFRVLDRRGLAESVRRGIEWLLSTRAPVAAAQLIVGQRTTLDYGVPDYGTFTAHGQVGMDRLARQVEAAITAFEPRLQGPRVSIAMAGVPVAVWTLTLTGTLMSGTICAPFQFETRLTQAARRGAEGTP